MEMESKEEGEGTEGQPLHSKRIKQFVKIALPHVALYVLLFFYLMAGAWAFASIEHSAERLQQLKKLERIDAVYRRISEEMIDECSIPQNQEEEFNEQLYESLTRLSQFVEGKDFKLTPYSFNSDENGLDAILPPRWNVMSSILYALSILTTTGYGSAAPMTPLGQWFSVGYGLIGIPLMILAAVDIGRFLSDVVLVSYSRIEGTVKKLSALFGFTHTKNSMMSQVETKALKVLQNTRRSVCSQDTACQTRVKLEMGKFEKFVLVPPMVSEVAAAPL